MIAAVACLMILAALQVGGLRNFVKAAPSGKRLGYGLAGAAAILWASVVLLSIVLFVWFGFGPFYLLISAVLIIFTVIPSLAVPAVNRPFEELTTHQLVWLSIAVTVVSLVLAFIYVAVANRLGFALQFGSVAG